MKASELLRRLYRYGLWAAVAASVIWTIWAVVHGQVLVQEVQYVPLVVLGLFVSELLFIVGAVIVAATLSSSLWIALRQWRHRLTLLAELAAAVAIVFVWSFSAWSVISALAVVVLGLGALVHKRYRELLQRVSASRWFWRGFMINWLGAVGTGVVLVAAVLMLLPPSSYGLVLPPLVDIVASIVWRMAVLRGRKNLGVPVKVRLANLADVPQLVALDAARYGQITEAQTNDPAAMFAARIRNSPGWFWVAETGGRLVGLVSLQSMRVNPDQFTSWDDTTRNGTFEGTYDPTSDVAYAAALTVTAEGSRLGATPLLIDRAIGHCVAKRKHSLYFAARMPGYHRKAPLMTAEEYYNARRPDGTALDAQIRFYEQMGMRRLRLVENGFAEDWQSCGYSVLFVVDLDKAG